jgi:DNA-binding MarR family transcriptional regulator
MEQLGLVARKRLPNDQRRVIVSLTGRSRALAARLAPRIEAVYAQIEDLLGAEFADRFYRTLDEVIAKLKPRRAAAGT